jgi:hypothetical protein
LEDLGSGDGILEDGGCERWSEVDMQVRWCGPGLDVSPFASVGVYLPNIGPKDRLWVQLSVDCADPAEMSWRG